MKNGTLQNMKDMRLLGMAQSYESSLSLPLNQQADTHELVAALVDAEQQHRQQKRMDMYIRLSRLRYKSTIPDIICSEKRNLSKTTLIKLADGAFIQRSENVLITGATGCGKSFLGCALVHQACVLGYRALYFNLNRFTEQIAIAKADGSIIKWLNRIKRAKLILLDDFGLQPMNQQVKLILLQILEDRYENGSTLVCSQLPVNKWFDYLNDPTIADAILDRLVPKSHRIDLKGKSLRKKLI
jgi:DNA replication protein DnaC